MTSLVAREEIADELFRAGVRSPLIPRLMQVIDRYAITMAHHIQPTTDWRPDTYGYLGPGATDITARVRRCLQCGKIRKLDTEFVKDSRVENGRRLRCITCSPPRRKSVKNAEVR